MQRTPQLYVYNGSLYLNTAGVHWLFGQGNWKDKCRDITIKVLKPQPGRLLAAV